MSASCTLLFIIQAETPSHRVYTGWHTFRTTLIRRIMLGECKQGNNAAIVSNCWATIGSTTTNLPRAVNFDGWNMKSSCAFSSFYQYIKMYFTLLFFFIYRGSPFLFEHSDFMKHPTRACTGGSPIVIKYNRDTRLYMSVLVPPFIFIEIFAFAAVFISVEVFTCIPIHHLCFIFICLSACRISSLPLGLFPVQFIESTFCSFFSQPTFPELYISLWLFR